MVFWMVPIKIDLGKTMQGGDTILRGGNGREYKDGLKAMVRYTIGCVNWIYKPI